MIEDLIKEFVVLNANKRKLGEPELLWEEFLSPPEIKKIPEPLDRKSL